ncbi:MAG: glucose 1-dehydrogenase [Deltaproteobacteria bacterium]|nr:glucose 1-dehydrogenase [Deltaproteobacteria bacterium]MBW2421031.1 glucose 1-dehydrogenase [Deltaproteobacteria bacterium]
MRLEGKVALVTGATMGIGRGIAHLFAQEGARVLLAGRSEDLGREVESEIRSAGGDACFVRTDVSCEDDVLRAVRTAVDRFGSLTVVVNNAAAMHLVGPGKGDAGVAEMRNEVVEELVRTNLYGAMWCSKHAIPEFRRAGGGSIVNISSNAAIRGTPSMAGYTATKGALNALTRSLAVDYAEEGIRANAISVGFIASGAGVEEFARQNEWIRQSIRVPFIGKPDDVAYGALYLASDESRYVTGVLLPIDGGTTA